MPPRQFGPGGFNGYLIDPTTKQPISPAREDGNLATVATNSGLIKAKTDNLDILLSLLGREATLALIKAKTDNLDVLLSSRASLAVQTDGTQRAGILDGSGSPLTSTVDGAKRRLDVRAQAEGAPEAAPPGTAIQTGGYDPETGTLRAMQLVNGLGTAFRQRTYSAPDRHHDAVDERLFSGQLEITVPNGGAENNIVLFRNPVGSGKTVSMQRMRFSSTRFDKWGVFRIYLNPTITTNGTQGTPANRYQKTSPAASAIQFFTLPAISARGTLFGTFPCAEVATGGPTVVEFDGDFIIAPGFNFLVTCTPESNGTDMALFGMWSEV